HRSQRRNREAAEARLVELVRRALAVPRTRVPTRPSIAAKERRLREKKRRAERKKDRRAGSDE
ncbi:MAG: aminoacyl-tRNA hydrolase, partial [Gemmatimonadaceae bacterium]